MLFKLILSHVLFEPRCSMITNKTINASCHSFRTGVRRSLTSSICSCSLKIKDTGLLARHYTTYGYQDGRRSRDTLMRETQRIMDSSERETLRQRLNSFTRQERKSSSIKRFEPCYKQIYPSKKRKATFKIPKKPPYIPAVYQRKTTSYKNKYREMVSGPVNGRHLQWPPLYPRKKKNQANQSNETNELPSWLLPLYSCKNCHSKKTPSVSEARYSGTAFHRKMENAESIKRIRAYQQVVLSQLNKKQAKNDDTTRHDAKKSTDAVETLKRKIDSMQRYLNGVKGWDAYRKRYARTNTSEPELAENRVLVREAYSRIYQTKPPSLAREGTVRKSMGIDIAGPKASEKALPGISNQASEQTVENLKEADIIKGMNTLKKQYNEERNHEIESNSSQQTVNSKRTPAERNNNMSLGQIHKESVVMIKQPTWKKQQIPNNQVNNDSKTLRATPKTMREETTKDTPTVNQLLKHTEMQEIKPQEDEGKTAANAWTVESLKTRINVMKINKTLDGPCANASTDMSRTRNGGEIKPKISQVALRSFHKEVGTKYTTNAQLKDVGKLRLGYQRTVGRRNFSTCRPPRMEPVARGLQNKRTFFSTSRANTGKKKTWINRFKKFFVLERVKSPKCSNWKESPREIPYERKADEYNSPAPILWKPPDMDRNLGEHRRSKHTNFKRERVNPATLNAEQRVLAGISRLMTAKPQSIPGFRAQDIEKKISRAEHQVNLMPWLKETKSYGNEHKSLPPRPCDRLELDEPQGTGYEWILRNRELVEDLKRQSQYAAGKSLVPPEVKNSINEYKLPLKAEISKYRKKIDQKCTDIFVYSTSKRWYSTCYSGKQRRILPCSDVFLVKKRGIKTTEYWREVANPGEFMDRKTRSDIEAGINLRRCNQRVDNVRRRIDDPHVNPEEEYSPKKWAWKIPNKTRAFNPILPLTSPNKAASTKMSEMSPCALKKQVDELKRLIKKAREEVAEKTEESHMEVQSPDNHEARLKRLIKAAHNNALKMQIVEPKYTSENNLLAKKSHHGEKVNPQPMIKCDAKPRKSKSTPEVSVLNSLFKKTVGEPKSLPDEILHRNNLTALPGSCKKPEKTIRSRVYIKLKSFVEAVRKRSAMLDALDAKLLPTPNLKSNIMNVNAVLPIPRSGKLTEGSENTSKAVDPLTVELLAEKTQAPSRTIQLWKGESKTKAFNIFKEKEPTYGDLMALFAKAKQIFYYQPPDATNLPQGILGDNDPNRWSEKSSDKASSKNWLSIREHESKAARTVSELKEDPSRKVESSQPSSSSLSSQPGIDSIPELMMNKPRLLPVDLLKSDAKMSCGHMWSNIPVSIHENEDLCGKTSIDYPVARELPSQHQEWRTVSPSTGKIPIAEGTQTAFNQHEPTRVILEPTKFLFQKPSITWESISHNFGSSLGRNLFRKPEENQNSTRQEAIFNRNQNKKTEDNPTVEWPKSSDFEATQTPQHDIKAHCLSPECKSSNQSPATPTGNFPKLDALAHKTTVLSTNDKAANMSSTGEVHCVPNLEPLEDKVRKYENNYRRHFTNDPISHYENLHLVYGEVSKINDLNKYPTDDSNNLPKEEKETSSQINDSIINTALQKTPEDDAIKLNSSVKEKIVDPDFQRPAKSKTTDTSNNTRHYEISDIFGGTEDISGKPDGNSSGSVHRDNEQEPNVSPQGISNANDIEHIASNQSGEHICQSETFEKGERTMKIDRHSEAYKESGETEKHERPESDVLTALPDKTTNAEDYSTTSKNEFGDEQEKTTNFDHLFMQDPTLNPEVVKKLKLPVIMSDQCHAEKNWYTTFQSGSHHNE